MEMDLGIPTTTTSGWRLDDMVPTWGHEPIFEKRVPTLYVHFVPRFKYRSSSVDGISYLLIFAREAMYGNFVKGPNLDVSVEKDEKRSIYDTKSALDTRTFYENLVGLNATETDRVTTPNERSIEKSCSPLDVSAATTCASGKNTSVKGIIRELFVCSAFGNVKKLQKLVLTHGAQILHCRDQYQWNLLMTAASKGQEDAVKFLLRNGVDCNCVDPSGSNAHRIAQKAGYYRTADIILKFQAGNIGGANHREDLEEHATDRDLDNTTDFCITCSVSYKLSEKSQHFSSTAHLFNFNKNRTLPNHNLPVNSVGYKLLQKGGWAEGQGLGVCSQGTTELIPTILKRDRSGIGTKKKAKKRVTHFKAFEEDSVKSALMPPEERRTVSMRTVKKQQVIRQRARSRQWEINLRSYMNI